MKLNKIDRYKIELCSLLFFTLSLMFCACDDSVLDKSSLSSLSASTFWTDESDALMGLTSVYSSTKGGGMNNNFYGFALHYLDCCTDNGCTKAMSRLALLTNGELSSTNDYVLSHWSNSYTRIAAANNFLENISSCEMDDDEKNEMIGEVRFMRAYQYFWLTQFFGDVPLVKKILTTSEANSLFRTSQDTVVAFIEEELISAIDLLPDARPDDEDGRIVKAAAQAILGRLYMSEERWSDASDIFQDIINSGNYALDARYKELFEDEGKGSDEIIYSVKYMEDDDGNNVHTTSLPIQFEGYHTTEPYNSLIKVYDMVDGFPQDESPLYDPTNPYLNKDPRLYYTIFLPGISTFAGVTYDPVNSGAGDLGSITYGYCVKKFTDEDYTGTLSAYGSDYPMIRYAEVLLSYLECEYEANNGNISQALLDKTVNAIRARDAVNMPAIALADFSKDRMRNERRVELAWEGLRYWDILRWEIADSVRSVDAIKSIYLTDDPNNYTGYTVDDEGFRIIGSADFDSPTNYLWPIPQTEIDINSNLTQNPGY